MPPAIMRCPAGPMVDEDLHGSGDTGRLEEAYPGDRLQLFRCLVALAYCWSCLG